MKVINPGDYFLLPFSGKRCDLLVRAERPHQSGHWHVRYIDGRDGLVLLSSCRRCSPSAAKKILTPTRKGNMEGGKTCP